MTCPYFPSNIFFHSPSFFSISLSTALPSFFFEDERYSSSSEGLFCCGCACGSCPAGCFWNVLAGCSASPALGSACLSKGLAGCWGSGLCGGISCCFAGTCLAILSSMLILSYGCCAVSSCLGCAFILSSAILASAFLFISSIAFCSCAFLSCSILSFSLILDTSCSASLLISSSSSVFSPCSERNSLSISLMSFSMSHL